MYVVFLQLYPIFLTFASGESTLRKRIQELQHYRRMGLTTAQDIERYENDLIKRVCTFKSIYYTAFSLILLQTQAKAQIAQGHIDRLPMRPGSRASTGPEARRMSVASFGDSEAGGHFEAPLRPNAPGSGASLFRKQRSFITKVASWIQCLLSLNRKL